MRRKEQAIYAREVFSAVNGRFVRTVKPEEVRVMVRCEGYAMVRHKGAAPFVVPESALTQIEQEGK